MGYAGMDQFIAMHADRLQGSLSSFDRVLFRGYLPFFSGYAMASFLETRKVHRRDVKARQCLSVGGALRAGPALCRSVCQPAVGARLDRYARQVNPLLRDLLTPMSYEWVTTQAEYATDLVCKSGQHLAEFFPRLLGHSTLCFSVRLRQLHFPACYAEAA